MFELPTYVTKKKFSRSIGLSPFYVDKVWLHFQALYFWNAGLNSVTQMIVRMQMRKLCFTWMSLLFYMNVSTIKNLMWMTQFNTSIISVVIATLFQIFSFQNSTCNKCYTAFAWMVKKKLENIWGIIRGINV